MKVIAPLAIFAAAVQDAGAVTFAVPPQAKAGGVSYAPLDPAPVGVSLEFFTMPSYLTNVTATMQCLENWKDLTGVWPPVRIGGTTQDRAQYDASTSAYVVYSVARAADAPMTLTFGPKFMSLAATYPGSVVLGLNRAKNNIQNTIAAAKVAVAEMKNLLAIELGNEPEYWVKDKQPIASGSWNNVIDRASQNDWNIRVGSAIGRTNIIQAGNWNDSPPQWGAAGLIATENATVRQYVRHYSHHNYPGGSIQKLMTHSTTVQNVRVFNADVASALAIGKEYVLGETNSVSGGGAAGVSPTFGAALWTMDYILRATVSNISRIYFHQGTVGNCQYCSWGRYSMGSPYYGQYIATAFMAGAKHIAALDAGTTNFAAYATFDAAGAPLRVLLYNSNHYTGGTRSSESFTLTGLTAPTVRAKRLTASSATARADQGGDISFGGQTFTDVTCKIAGAERYETVTVSGGQVTFSVKATEALLMYLQ
ncbi:hypothetical protein QBC34DRAFT_487209 [Podospora aff. communis PSN243]|uniref:Beta-glucuronidase C-terminal domain-containing protein n=1 Tax=Podospora aff. communis PSN243 TaxID=3040156 RepID=A0AAV9GDV9_9PEZI|nr:hypothetical protein QBC34DRAFT_487209 [Podospora aff. communis PSN243]